MAPVYGTFPSHENAAKQRLESREPVEKQPQRPRKRLNCCQAFCVGIFFFIVLIVSLWAVGRLGDASGGNLHEHTIPRKGKQELNETCHWCIIDVPKEQAEWPAVGFDLTESYGTATIKFPSGETTCIGPIEGDEAYKNAMHKLSLESSKHTAPPYDWFLDPPGGIFAGLYDSWTRRWLRSLRKKIGLPPTSEVGCIASVLKRLLVETNRAIQPFNPEQDATKAVITSPDLLALYDEDIYDIAEYSGLDATSTYPFLLAPFPKSLLSTLHLQRQPKYADAAFMGYGRGLCAHPESMTACRDEEARMEHKQLIAVYVSRQAVSVECPWGGKAVAGTRMLGWQQHASFFDDGLGLDESEREGYWEGVRGLVLDCMSGTIAGWRNVTDVLLLGERAADERVKEEVRRAVMERPQVFDPGFYLDAEPAFVASRGAAEMAARILWTPDGCGFDEPLDGHRKCQKEGGSTG